MNRQEASAEDKPPGESEQNYFEQAFEAVADTILFLDHSGSILQANPASSQMYGYSLDELKGFEAKKLFAPKDIYKFDLSLDRAKRLEKDSRFKALHFTKSGSERHVLVHAKVIAQNIPAVIILYIKDITQRVHTEDRLRKSRLEAEASDIAKSQFLANISHEIRTPMNVILGYASLLKDESLESMARAQFLESILNNGEALVKLIDRLLDISKVETGSLAVEKETFALYPALREIIRTVEARLEAKNIEFKLDYKLALTAQIKTDPNRLRQILINLLVNAVKFTREGSVELRVANESENRLVFQVIDTGIGIPKEEWKRLFNPFTQVDETITRNYGGGGLGLAVSKHLAKVLGGNLYVKKSLPGKGSVFEFWLESNCGEQTNGSIKDNEKFETLKAAKILLVEDMEENQTLIKHYLRELDCKLDVVSDGKEALDILKHKSYDLILMDLQMPRLDGFGATDLIRRKGLKTPIIALTAHSLKEDVERCLRSGFNAHLSKPIASKELLLKVRQMCAVKMP